MTISDDIRSMAQELDDGFKLDAEPAYIKRLREAADLIDKLSNERQRVARAMLETCGNPEDQVNAGSVMIEYVHALTGTKYTEVNGA